MPSEADSNLNDATFAPRSQTVDSQDVLNVKGVAIGDVPGAIQAYDTDVGRTIFYDSISFHGRGRLHESAFHLEVRLDRSHLVHSFALDDFLFGRLRLFPGRCDHILSTLTCVELIEWISGIVSQERPEKVLS